MTAFYCGIDDAKLLFEYEDMIEDMIDAGELDLSKYPDDDVRIIINFIPKNVIPKGMSINDYAESIYRKCLKEKKPWQEFLTLNKRDYTDKVY